MMAIPSTDKESGIQSGINGQTWGVLALKNPIQSVIRCDPGVILPIRRKMTSDEKTPNICKSESFKFVLLHLESLFEKTLAGQIMKVSQGLEETYFLTIDDFPFDNQMKKALVTYTWNNIYASTC